MITMKRRKMKVLRMMEWFSVERVQCDMNWSEYETMKGMSAAIVQSIKVGRNSDNTGLCQWGHTIKTHVYDVIWSHGNCHHPHANNTADRMILHSLNIIQISEMCKVIPAFITNTVLYFFHLSILQVTFRTSYKKFGTFKDLTETQSGPQYASLCTAKCTAYCDIS